MARTDRARMSGLVLAAAVGLCGGCGQDDADRLARMGHKAAAKFDDVTAGARDKLARGWSAVRGTLSEATPDGRVSLRLGWDKQLSGSSIEVSSPAAGVVRLQGKVANVEQQRRAVGLAEATEGVEKVVDELTVGRP
jgi:hypothetical protein